MHQRYHISAMIDWPDFRDLVDRHPGKCGGQWCIKGTRIPVRAIIDNARDFTAEQIATEIYEGVSVDVVRQLLHHLALR
jgi:uncharacterized protein (DUF433 family)